LQDVRRFFASCRLSVPEYSVCASKPLRNDFASRIGFCLDILHLRADPARPAHEREFRGLYVESLKNQLPGVYILC
jgi:hypothetical protein